MPVHLDGEYGAPGNVPVTDQNIVTPAAVATGTANPNIPAEEMPKTPEFLKKLIAQFEELRNEQSALFAKMYPMSMHSGNNATNKPSYETMEMYHQQDLELDKKMAGLRGQIQEMRVLIVQPIDPKPEAETEPPRTVAAPAAEIAGPA